MMNKIGKFEVVMQNHELTGLLVKFDNEKKVVVVDAERNKYELLNLKMYEMENAKTTAWIVAENEQQARELLVKNVELHIKTFKDFNTMTVEEAQALELKELDLEEEFFHEDGRAKETVAGYLSLCQEPEFYGFC